MGLGWHLGFDYKRGKFFYWQVGIRYNNAVYKLKEIDLDSADFVNVPVRGIDVPITGGVNFLSAINRIVALRLFVSAVPSFAFGVGDNDLGFDKDAINAFIMYGQAGLGINVAFLVLEAGYNFGFKDLLKDYESISAAAKIPAGQPGSLYGAISHNPGNSPMPKNGTQLSDCKIKQVKVWIDAGTPNN